MRINQSRRSGYVVSGRTSKTLLLPMPRSSADDLALRAHIAFDTMRRGQGAEATAQNLLQVLFLVGIMSGTGIGGVEPQSLILAEKIIASAIQNGRNTGNWVVDAEAFESLKPVAVAYDLQLHQAPLWAVADASARLGKLGAMLPN
ncbi:hypothetical protein ATN79_44860 [Paraburkholderia caribensis]|nr:hypothetical protein ATN79_44860 [Paraburkholderia caribensis]